MGRSRSSVWTGAITFGLVSVPVKLYTTSTERKLRFNQLNADTGSRVKQKRVDSGTGKEVDFAKIIRGFEITPDHYVTISDDEIDALAPARTKTIKVECFVNASEIDPLIFNDSYYIEPVQEVGGAKPYDLLLGAMEQSDQVAIGRFVMRSSEQLVLVRPHNGALMLTGLKWADEIQPPPPIEPPQETPSDLERAMAVQIVQTMSEGFDHIAYEDTFRNKVLALIEAKASGSETPEPEGDEQVESPDLMAALEATLDSLTAEPPVTAKGKAKSAVTRKRKAKVEA